MIIISSFVRLTVLVVLVAHAIAQTDSISRGQIVEALNDAAMITANKVFDSIRNDPEYQQIMAKLTKQ